MAQGDTRSRGFVGWTFVYLAVVSLAPFSTSPLSEHHDEALSVVIFSFRLGVAGLALIGMWRAALRHAAAHGKPHAPNPSSRRAIILLLVSAVIAIGLAVFSPTPGTLVWIVFPVIAFLTARRTKSGAS